MKICEDCKWMTLFTIYCKNPDVFKDYKSRVFRKIPIGCIDARWVGNCGEEAKFFEPKIPFLRRIKNCLKIVDKG